MLSEGNSRKLSPFQPQRKPAFTSHHCTHHAKSVKWPDFSECASYSWFPFSFISINMYMSPLPVCNADHINRAGSSVWACSLCVQGFFFFAQSIQQGQMAFLKKPGSLPFLFLDVFLILMLIPWGDLEFFWQHSVALINSDLSIESRTAPLSSIPCLQFPQKLINDCVFNTCIIHVWRGNPTFPLSGIHLRIFTYVYKEKLRQQKEGGRR